jgi:hypothetical protein
MKCFPAIIFCFTMIALCSIAEAQVTATNISVADAFLATGSPNNPLGADLTGLNFGAGGALVVAPASSYDGEYQSLLKFNLSNAIALFNTNYGAGRWLITSASLALTSNYGTSGVQPNSAAFPVITGGNFAIEWLSNDNWVEGTGTPNIPTTDGVDYNSLPDLLSGAHEILGTNTYTPPGNNISVIYALPLTANLVADLTGGGDVTFLLYAADNQIGYLFNSYNYGRGNQPLIMVTAAPLVEILSGTFTNDSFQLTGIGNHNVTYQIQASTNLATTNWQTIGTATADSSGTIQFDDTGASNQPQRFYRFSQ